MKLHAEILRPKFELVCKTFAEKFEGTSATFNAPSGGYFVSVEIPGKAKRVRDICKKNGVLITEAGATFPYGNDPADSNLRFAPTFLSISELEQALEIFCEAVRTA
jgi:DNA-binding transcriptional MocR family regulator